MREKRSNEMILWFFLTLFLLSSFLLYKLLMPFLPIIIMAAVVAWLFRPVYLFLINKSKISPPFASLLTCIIIFIILFIPIIFFGGVLSSEAYDLYIMGKSAVISGHLKNLLAGSSVLDKINKVLANINISLTIGDLNSGIMTIGKFTGKILFDNLTAITSNILKFIANFFFMLLVIYFLFLDGQKLVDFIMDISPLPQEQDKMLIIKFKDMADAVLVGNGLGGLIQGTAGGILFAVFGLKSPFLWGVIMGLLAFLPILGIGAVFIPASIYMFLTGKIFTGLFFIVFYLLLSGGVEYLLKPKIVGNRVKMHTLLVFLSIIGGLKMFGILGIVYGPLVVTGFLTLVDIYHSSYQNIVEPVKTVTIKDKIR